MFTLTGAITNLSKNYNASDCKVISKFRENSLISQLICPPFSLICPSAPDSPASGRWLPSPWSEAPESASPPSRRGVEAKRKAPGGDSGRQYQPLKRAALEILSFIDNASCCLFAYASYEACVGSACKVGIGETIEVEGIEVEVPRRTRCDIRVLNSIDLKYIAGTGYFLF